MYNNNSIRSDDVKKSQLDMATEKRGGVSKLKTRLIY